MIINNNNNNINFGQKFPTSSLLKMGSGIFDFEDAKRVCHAVDDKFPGHVGYYQKALHYLENIRLKNPDIRDLLAEITKNPIKEDRKKEISKIVKTLGEEIDLVI